MSGRQIVLMGLAAIGTAVGVMWLLSGAFQPASIPIATTVALAVWAAEQRRARRASDEDIAHG